MNKMFILLFSSTLLFASVEKEDLNKTKVESKKVIKYGVRTELPNGGYIIYVDKNKTGDIQYPPKRKIVKKKYPMPEVYKKLCVKCHGIKGDKSPKEITFKTLYIGGLSKFRIAKKLDIYKRNNFSTSGTIKIMADIAKKLTLTDIRDIALYLSSLEKVKEKKKVVGPQLPKNKESNISEEDFIE